MTGKVCTEPGCPNLRPCTLHAKPAWAGSTRDQHVASGSRQQTEARFVMRRDHGICHVCGLAGADRVDHIIPVAEGGADNVANKAPIHQTPCHDKKTAEESARARKRNRGHA